MIDEDKMKPLVDHNATNIRKRQLLAEGRKLWDKDEAQWYHNRGIPYDGVDYRVFKEMTHYYEFCFVRSSIFSFNHQELDISDVISNKLRGNTYETFAEMCKSLDEIYNLQVDIKFKLHIMLTKYPGKYTNFIRNATQRKQDRENFK
jgi:hypothetical protein